MKQLLIVFCCLILLEGKTTAQEKEFKKFSYGFQLSRFQDEFGIGIHSISPEYKSLRLSLRANLNWLNHLDDNNDESWSNFTSTQFGIHYHKYITNKINLYSEGGIVSLFPNSTFSSKDYYLGGYGLFGFEFFFTENDSSNSSYFVELGGIGTGAVADKIISNPIYANGFLIAVGYRF